MAISASTNPPIRPSTLPATPIGAPSATSSAYQSPSGHAQHAQQRELRAPSHHGSACVEKTSRPPVNSATSASTFRLTRYERDRLSLAATSLPDAARRVRAAKRLQACAKAARVDARAHAASRCG